MEKEEFKELLKKYRSGRASKEETDFLHAYYRLFEYHSSGDNETQKAEIKKQIKDNLHKVISQDRAKPPLRRLGLIAASFALILLAGVVALYLLKPETSSQRIAAVSKAPVTDIAPGSNKAVLTLADGSSVILDAAPTGVLARQGHTKVEKTADGMLEYHSGAAGPSSGEQRSQLINTISTPKGGQYQLTLPDGSRVWLNAASSITFPASFPAGARKVEIKGEVYFEVAPNKGRPFRVLSRQQDIEVLGTHFNINAYEDEPTVTTTLLEGSIRVRPAGAAERSSRILKPGQQSQISGSAINVLPANTEEAVAWKNGYFMFYRADLKTVMRQIARWYNADVRFEGKIPDDEFVGKIKRTEHVSGVLRILELGHVSSRIEGNQIIISSRN